MQSCESTNSMSVIVRPVSSADFTAECVFGRFTAFDLAARYAPLAGPLVSADHQHLAKRIVNQRADGCDGPAVAAWQGHAVGLQGAFELNQVRGDVGGVGFAELIERVVTGEQRAGVNAAVVRRLDIVLHVADVQRLVL